MPKIDTKKRQITCKLVFYGTGLGGKTTNLRYIHQKSEGKLPIIAVGGIMSVQDAINMLDAGATLIQLYTGFIYEGPGLARRINRAILKRRAAES